jgi:hypothetical protein
MFFRAFTGSGIARALSTLFNVLTLNLVLLIACVPVVTAPAALVAATRALDRWRADGEDRVVREFLRALRRPGVTVSAGVPLTAVAVGVLEIWHFARAAGAADRVALGFGTVATAITLAALGYVLTLAGHGLRPADLWTLCVRLAVRNLLVTGPLFLLEIGVVVAVAAADPALLLLGLPVLLLQLMRLTARLGLTRCGIKSGERPATRVRPVCHDLPGS